MSFAKDLLEASYGLANADNGNPNQACLRRALSTGYYALFHLLIEEATNMWAVERQRSIIGRTFDHSRMKAICEGILKSATGGAGVVPSQLQKVSRTFVVLQEIRHQSDYDNSIVWSRHDVHDILDLVSNTFDGWFMIRSDAAAQDFLLDLLLPKRTR